MKVKILKPCLDQETKKRLKPGDVHEFESDFDLGHNLAFGNCEIYDGTVIERAVKKVPATRRRGGKRKADVTETDNAGNG